MTFILKGRLFRVRSRVAGNWWKFFICRQTFPQGTVVRIKLSGILTVVMVSNA